MKLSVSSVLLLVLFAGSVMLIGYNDFKVNYGGILPYIKQQSAKLPGFESSGAGKKIDEANGEGEARRRFRLAIPKLTEVAPPLDQHSAEDEEKLNKLLEE